MPLSTIPTARFFRSVLALALVSLEGDVQVTNDVTNDLLGRSGDELAGTAVAALCVGDDLPAWRAELQRARAGQEGGQVLLHLRRGDGEQVPCLFTWSLIPGEDGATDYLSVVLLDQSERLEAERRLAASEARWRVISTYSSDAVWLSDAAGLLVDIPLSLSEVTSEDEWRGRRVHDFVLQEDLARFTEAFDAVAHQGRQQARAEVRIHTRTDAVRWVTHTITDLRDDPAVGALVGSVVDVTNLRAQRAAARRAASTFEARFRRSDLPQAVIDLGGVLTDVNPALAPCWAGPREELVGRSILDLLHPGEYPRAQPGPGRGAARGAGRRPARARASRAPVAGRSHCACDVTLLRDEEGAPYGASAHLLDQSPLAESERRRRQQGEFHAALDALSNALVLIVSPDGDIVYVSPHVTELLGVDLVTLQSDLAAGLSHPDDLPRTTEVFLRVSAGGPPGDARRPGTQPHRRVAVARGDLHQHAAQPARGDRHRAAGRHRRGHRPGRARPVRATLPGHDGVCPRGHLAGVDLGRDPVRQQPAA